MNIILFIILCIICSFIMWKLLSERHNIPCPAWLAWMVELDNPLAKAHKANEIIKSLKLKDNIQILDIGCGPGRVTIPLAKRISSMNGNVTCLDIQKKMLEKVKYRALQQELNNIKYINSKIEDINVKSKFDIILMICLLGEVPKKQHRNIIKKISSMLTINGVISFTETIFDPHYQSRNYITKLMTELGFIEEYFTGSKLAYTIQFKLK